MGTLRCDDLTVGMDVESRKPGHPLYGHLWLPCRVMKIDDKLVQLALLTPSGKLMHEKGDRREYLIFIGFRQPDGRLLDDSAGEIEIRRKR